MIDAESSVGRRGSRAASDTGAVDVRVAKPGDLDVVLAVLDDAAGWLRRRGIDQWPARFAPERLAPAIEAGEIHLGVEDGQPVGTFSLLWADPVIWGDCPDGADAGYVHQLAVPRAAAGRGIGDRLLAAADALVAARGRRWLRLDCVAHNRGLRRYYAERGFMHCGDVAELPRMSPAWQVASRYQRLVDLG
jgi:GNAT superfamily N-acetyltransferase